MPRLLEVHKIYAQWGK